ncbi:MAG: ribosomal-processing cysteine protease Prp [Ruminococcus sp.]|nr:ribosomal-processing cysteine protease Prp [Ruminococcus sp.]
MISSVFYRKDKQFYAFEVRDHADFAESGKDIVCAAVSSAVQLTVNLLDAFGCRTKTAAVGCLVRCFTNAEYDSASKIIKQLILHLDSIAEEFPETIKITISEV